MQVERNIVPGIVRAGIASRRIGLPDLDHGVGNERTPAVTHATGNFNHLALGSSGGGGDVEDVMLGGKQVRPRADLGRSDEVRPALPGQAVMKNGPTVCDGVWPNRAGS